MKNKKRMHLNIGTRAYLLGIIPAITTATILSSFLIYSHISDQRAAMSVKGQLLADNLVNKSEFGFYTGETKTLNRILEAAVGKDDILYAAIYDNKNEIIAYKDIQGNKSIPHLETPSFLENTPYLIFNRSFRSNITPEQEESLEELFLPSRSENEDESGYLTLGISLANSYKMERKRILFGVAITLGVMIIAVLISTLATRSVINPIRRTARVLARIENGDLSVRSTIDFNDALGDLQKNINSMAHTLEQNKQQQEEFTKALILSKRNAEVANISKGNFLAMMSHELRTPMNGVFGMLEILEHTKLENEQKRYLDIAKSSSSHLLTIIDDILDFSRIERGKFIIEKTFVDPVNLINECVNGLRGNSEKKDIELELIYQKGFDKIEIETDTTRLRQILVNLLGNAIKFTHKGYVRCHVSHTVQTGDHSLIIMKIEDTGIGIDADHLEHIFNSFEQADNSTVRNYGGTGLGLAISQRLTELLGGSITVESQLNSGSTFTVTIPMRVRKAAAPSPLESKQSNETPRWGARALVAEDNSVNQIITQTLLEKLGLTVEIVENGQLAVKKCSEHKFDIIFMDCQMPVMDGYQATQAIRAAHTNKETPIIAITANAMPEHKQMCFDAGMNERITKPIKQAIVIETLCKYLK